MREVRSKSIEIEALDSLSYKILNSNEEISTAEPLIL